MIYLELTSKHLWQHLYFSYLLLLIRQEKKEEREWDKVNALQSQCHFYLPFYVHTVTKLSLWTFDVIRIEEKERKKWKNSSACFFYSSMNYSSVVHSAKCTTIHKTNQEKKKLAGEIIQGQEIQFNIYFVE